MAKQNKTTTNQNNPSIFNKTNAFFESRKTQSIIGTLLFLISIFLMTSFISYFTNRNWEKDQSQLNFLADKTIVVNNFLGKIGAEVSQFLIFDGFGIATFILPVLLFFTGLYLTVGVSLKKRFWSWSWAVLGMIWISVTFAAIDLFHSTVSGKIGYELND